MAGVGASAMLLLRLFLHYPELLLALASFFCLSLYLHLNRGRRSSFPVVNWPIVGMLPAVFTHYDCLHDFIAKWLPELGNNFMFKGPLFLGMDFLITCDPADINHICSSRFHNYAKGDDFKEMFDVLGNGLFNTDLESWKIQRKMFHAILGDRKFRSFVADKSLKKIRHGLVPFLDDIAQKGLVVDVQDVFIRYAFDMACLNVFGVDAMSLSSDLQVNQVAMATRDVEDAIHYRHLVPACFWKLQRWLNFGWERKLGMARKAIDQLIGEEISKRRSIEQHQEYTHNSDLLTACMNWPMDDSKVKFDSNFLRDTTLTFLIAGNATIATSLSWLVYLVAKHPHVERKILDELEAACRTEEPSSARTTAFDIDAVGSMVYLHATVLETVRLFPSVPLDHKGALEDDILPSGLEIKAGARIIIAIYAMARAKGIWGEDCMEFKPERWISKDGSIKREPSYKFMTFGTGPRFCVGREVSFVLLKMLGAAVFYNFHVEVVDGQDVKPASSTILYMANGCRVRIKKRDM